MRLTSSSAGIAAALLHCAVAAAQTSPTTAGAAAPSAARPGTTAAEQLITLELPENVDLKVLVDYISRRLGLNIIFDEQSVAQKITVKAPTPVPQSSLLPILESALRSKNLALVDAEVPGWKRIVTAQNLAGAGSRAVTTQPSDQAPPPARRSTCCPLLRQRSGVGLGYPHTYPRLGRGIPSKPLSSVALE